MQEMPVPRGREHVLLKKGPKAAKLRARRKEEEACRRKAHKL